MKKYFLSLLTVSCIAVHGAEDIKAALANKNHANSSEHNLDAQLHDAKKEYDAIWSVTKLAAKHNYVVLPAIESLKWLGILKWILPNTVTVHNIKQAICKHPMANGHIRQNLDTDMKDLSILTALLKTVAVDAPLCILKDRCNNAAMVSQKVKNLEDLIARAKEARNEIAAACEQKIDTETNS